MSPLDENAEREYDQLMTEAIGADRSPRTAEIAERVRDMLLDAEQAGRLWASKMLDDDQLAGCAMRAKRWQAAHEERLLVAHNGQVVGKARRKGQRRRNAETGETAWQRTLFDDFTWDELQEFLDAAIGRIRAEDVNVESARRLMKLREEVPDSTGPADAARRLGTSIDAVLAEAS